MRRLFDCNARNDGENWLVAWTGQDRDGKHYNIETVCVHASEYSAICHGAKEDGELIASLLNWYHNDDRAPELIESFVKQLDEEIPKEEGTNV